MENANSSESEKNNIESEVKTDDEKLKDQNTIEYKEESKSTGIRAMLDKALLSYERLPMLEIVFDRFVRILATSLRSFTSDTVDVNIKSISSLRFGSYINSVSMPALVTIFKVIEWESFGLIAADNNIIYSLVDILFGGRKSNQPVKYEGRPYTTIEQALVKQLSEIILTDLNSSFDPLTPATFLFERIENNPRFATIARPADAAILLQLKIEMDSRGGQIEVLFPYATLEPIRDQLLQVFVGEKFGKDSEWESHLQSEIMNTNIDLKAILDKKNVLMHEIINLKIGSTIIMDISPQDDILLYCKDIKMFTGKLGKTGSKIAININSNLNSQKEDH